MSEVLREGLDPSLVFEFDFNSDPLLEKDVHEGYLKLKQIAPPIFYTPANGGHWVVTDSGAIDYILKHPETYSSNQSLSSGEDGFRLIPQSLDPPEHGDYRELLKPLFEGKYIKSLEPRIRQWADTIIDRVIDQDEFEFVDEVASRLPVSVFMEQMGLPLEKLEEFRELVAKIFASSDREQSQQTMMVVVGELMQVIEARKAEPRDDFITQLVTMDFKGRKLEMEELLSICMLMFLAGLDTVTTAMTFAVNHLARHPELQKQMQENREKIPDLVEEMLRRYGVANVPRSLTQDTEINGVSLKKGDMILCCLPLFGLDESVNPGATEVQVDRKNRRYAVFGRGPHTCLGLHLARLELRIFYEHWFSRMPIVGLDDNWKPAKPRAGTVMTIPELHLKSLA